MRQFYEMLMTAVTQHNTELDRGIGLLLDTAQVQDIVKQIVDRTQPAMDSRNAVLGELIARLRAGRRHRGHRCPGTGPGRRLPGAGSRAPRPRCRGRR